MTSVLIDGDYATVETDDHVAVARALLDAAADPADVVTVSTRSGTGFRVPVGLVDALRVVPRPDGENGDEGQQEGGGGTPPAVVPPKSNASRSDWAAFLTAQEVKYTGDETRDELRDLWKAKANADAS